MAAQVTALSQHAALTSQRLSRLESEFQRDAIDANKSFELSGSTQKSIGELAHVLRGLTGTTASRFEDRLARLERDCPESDAGGAPLPCPSPRFAGRGRNGIQLSFTFARLAASTSVVPSSAGEAAIRMFAAVIALIFSAAVPLPPEMIAPA